MKVTQNAMRADGLTVGQAQEKDRQFLQYPPRLPDKERLDAHVQKVREAVLDALDLACGDSGKGKGWIDQDLPELFKAVDRQAEIQFERLGL